MNKILLIIPNLGKGGAQQVFRDQLQFLSKNYDTLGCVFNWDDTFIDDRSTKIISLDIPAGKNWPDKIASFSKRVIAGRKIKKQHKIRLSISHLEGADYVNLLSKSNDKIICWIHGSKRCDENIEGFLGILRKKILIPLTYKKCDKIVTVSDGIREELITHFRIPAHKITTIYNSLDLEDISQKMTLPIQNEHRQLFDASPVIITHCRLSRQKNLFALIDIFISIKYHSKAKLVVLGDGELRAELLKYCESKKLAAFAIWQDNAKFSVDFDIYFLGYERNPYPYLSRAALYVMTSSWEGFPLSLCEAMASGVPVMSSDCFTGPREIISPGLEMKQPLEQPQVSQYGVLMPLAKSDTLASWTETIVTLLNDKVLRDKMISKGKERVLDFDRKKISAQWLDLIEKS